MPRAELALLWLAGLSRPNLATVTAAVAWPVPWAVFLPQPLLAVVGKDDVQQFGRAPELRRCLPPLVVSGV